MAGTLTIDASALGAAGFDSTAYFTDFFAGLASGDGMFYGGTPDSAFGATYYMNGDQHVRHYTDGTDPVSAAVLTEGADLAYDFIHSGMAYGHGISGQVDSLTFGDWVDGTTTGTQGTGEAGLVTGFATEVRISGFDLIAEVGAGNDLAANPVYALYSAVQNLDAAAIEEVLSHYGVEMIGTSGDDALFGTDNDDVLTGMGGDDVMNGNQGRDVLLGMEGDDLLSGARGADYLVGGAGSDTIYGGKQNDTILGGAGDDRIIGGQKTDLLTGGDGADTFVIWQVSDRDVITDFDGSEDLLDVSALGLTTLADFTVTETATRTILETGDVEIHLLDVAAATLDDSMFVWA
ncbi:calcium-binding protein [Mesobacterium pallidum]|uniref:calcium-binding protein n=1 Tax=Mesobacterium pallidum TaxID=2872037 RepID=UPI001EE260B2|nr:calcium-binding protein [Mesobacterium pallidum]